MNGNAVCRTQRYRVYQLDTAGIASHRFAFGGIDQMRREGYRQPPADSYQLIYDGELEYPSGVTALSQIFYICNNRWPKGYQGHSLALSDVVELYDESNRSFYYRDYMGFVPVLFDAARAKPMGV